LELEDQSETKARLSQDFEVKLEMKAKKAGLVRKVALSKDLAVPKVHWDRKVSKVWSSLTRSKAAKVTADPEVYLVLLVPRDLPASLDTRVNDRPELKGLKVPWEKLGLKAKPDLKDLQAGEVLMARTATVV